MFDHCRNHDRACKAWNSRFAGPEAGCIKTKKESKTSYFHIGISINEKRKFYWAHRLVFLYIDGYFPPEDVDHIDGNGLNNARNNLRKVSHQENQKNMPMRSDSTSGAVGVTWNKQKQKWQVQIEVNGRNIYGGRFINKSDAIHEGFQRMYCIGGDPQFQRLPLVFPKI